MNREVELVLSGLHASGQEQESEAVETVQPAQYFKRNDSHYLLYEEKMDEDQAPCRSRIKFRDHLLELTRQGTAEMHMIFEENKRHMIPYNTPYGQLMLGIETSRVLVEEQEDQIHVTVEYSPRTDPGIFCRRRTGLPDRKGLLRYDSEFPARGCLSGWSQ